MDMLFHAIIITQTVFECLWLLLNTMVLFCSNVENVSFIVKFLFALFLRLQGYTGTMLITK